jgi:signal transduction histidine kinase
MAAPRKEPATRRARRPRSAPTPDAAASPRRVEATLERRIKRLERTCVALRASTDAAEAAQRELLAVVTHDLRNPLSVILVSARLLLRSLPEDDSRATTRKQIEAMGRAADEMSHLVQDLVDATHIDAGELALGFETLEAGPIVQKAVSLLEPSAARKPLSLTTQISPDLPRLLVDRERVVQALGNLLANSVRFTPKGGAITVRASAHDGEVRFEIADTGPGIAPAQRAALFKRERPEGSCLGQGTGLGVFVAKGIVEAHGGKIWVESTPGRGATFCFTLPSVEIAELRFEPAPG